LIRYIIEWNITKEFQIFRSFLVQQASNRVYGCRAMGELTEDKENICLGCGACCAAYRVSFYWSEAKELGLENAFTEKLTSFRLCMAGTRSGPVRCRALRGDIGGEVFCMIYSRRPSPCREVQPGDEKCNRARARHGLNPTGRINPINHPGSSDSSALASEE